MDKFKNKLPKDDLKKFAKEVGKKLVASDFKHNRVEDPTRISSKQEQKVKKYVKDYFDKAVAKKLAHDKERARRKAQASTNGNKASKTEPVDEVEIKAEVSDVDMSDDDDDSGNVDPSIPATPDTGTPNSESLKRKRDNDSLDALTPNETPTSKRVKDESATPPPPPPPPPAAAMGHDIVITEKESEFAAQEEALMRENEEALIKENEDAMKDAEAHDEEVNKAIPGSIDAVDVNQADELGLNVAAFALNRSIDISGAYAASTGDYKNECESNRFSGTSEVLQS